MLNGIKIFSSDPVWCHILSDFGAIIIDTPNVLAVNFDKIMPTTAITSYELKSLILNNTDKANVLKSVFGDNVPQLSDIQENIIISLAMSGGMTGNQLRDTLGYMPDIATHTIDTAIYTLRKVYGRDFIKLENGVYKIGTI